MNSVANILHPRAVQKQVTLTGFFLRFPHGPSLLTPVLELIRLDDDMRENEHTA